MDSLIRVPGIFIVAMFLITALATLFFKINPIKNIKQHKVSINYFMLFYFAMTIAFLSIRIGPEWLVNPMFLLAAYLLRYGFLWRNNSCNKHIQKDLVVYINLLFIILISTYFASFRSYRVMILDINMAIILISCLKLLAYKGHNCSNGVKIMRISLIFSSIIISLTWIPLFITQDSNIHFATVFINQLLVIFIIFGSLLTLQLSDIIDFHYKNSVTDTMTSLFNRRYFIENSKAIISSSKRYGYNVSIILCDLDKFKLINDKYGHDVGDQVIIKFGDILKSCTRDSDIVARFGVTSFKETSNIEHNIKEADDALYNAKKSGRNQINLHMQRI